MLLIALLYVVVHFCVYIGVLRHRLEFSAERVIFIYHFASFIVVLVSCLFCITIENEGSRNAVEAIGAISLHGIYSLSFLEAWSLCQGSYSLGILRRLHETNRLSRLEVDALESTGDEKLRCRLKSLLRLGLISHTEGDRWRRTVKGRAVSICLELALQSGGVNRLETLSSDIAPSACQVARLGGVQRFSLGAMAALLMLATAAKAFATDSTLILCVSLGYLFFCELYIFLITLVASSISVGILLRSSESPTSFATLYNLVRASGMAAGRLEGLRRVGLIQHDGHDYSLTTLGRAVATLTSAVRRVFFPSEALSAK